MSVCASCWSYCHIIDGPASEPAHGVSAEHAYVDRVRQVFGEASCVQAAFTLSDEFLAADRHAHGIQFDTVRRAWLLG